MERKGGRKSSERTASSSLTTAQYLINKLHLFYDIDVDLLIFDEVHVGGKAEEISNIRRYFDQSYVIDVSGTLITLGSMVIPIVLCGLTQQQIL